MPDYANADEVRLSAASVQESSDFSSAIRDELFSKLSVYSCKITHDASKSRDIAKESLDKMDKCLDRLHTREQCEKFLYLATRNASIDYLQYLSKSGGAKRGSARRS